MCRLYPDLRDLAIAAFDYIPAEIRFVMFGEEHRANKYFHRELLYFANAFVTSQFSHADDFNDRFAFD